MNLLVGAITIGLILSLLALGVFLTYRVFGLLDVTTDGAFGVGAATAAALLSHGWPPAAATAVGGWAGAMAGLVTGMVHTRFGVNALLAGILTTTALYSGNLYIMGGGDRSIANVPTLITRAEQVLDWLAPGTETLSLFGTPVVARTIAALLLMLCWCPSSRGSGPVLPHQPRPRAPSHGRQPADGPRPRRLGVWRPRRRAWSWRTGSSDSRAPCSPSIKASRTSRWASA